MLKTLVFNEAITPQDWSVSNLDCSYYVASVTDSRKSRSHAWFIQRACLKLRVCNGIVYWSNFPWLVKWPSYTALWHLIMLLTTIYWNTRTISVSEPFGPVECLRRANPGIFQSKLSLRNFEAGAFIHVVSSGSRSIRFLPRSSSCQLRLLDDSGYICEVRAPLKLKPEFACSGNAALKQCFHSFQVGGWRRSTQLVKIRVTAYYQPKEALRS